MMRRSVGLYWLSLMLVFNIHKLQECFFALSFSYPPSTNNNTNIPAIKANRAEGITQRTASFDNAEEEVKVGCDGGDESSLTTKTALL